MTTFASGARRPSMIALHMVVLTAFAIVGTAVPARAAQISYVWQNGAGLKFPGTGTVLAISGQFTYDTVTETLSNFETTLTPVSGFAGCACVGSATSGLLNYQNGITTVVFSYFSAAAGGPVEPHLHLDTPVLGGPGPYYLGGKFGPGTLVSGVGIGGAYLLVDSGNAPFIQAVSSTPEPATWLMLLAGMLLVGVRAARGVRTAALR